MIKHKSDKESFYKYVYAHWHVRFQKYQVKRPDALLQRRKRGRENIYIYIYIYIYIFALCVMVFKSTTLFLLGLETFFYNFHN